MSKFSFNYFYLEKQADLNIFYIDYLYINNVENNLPYTNITTDSPFCVNINNFNNVNVNISIEIEDIEVDTPYYATQSLLEKNYNSSIRYSYASCVFGIFCSPNQDFTFYENTYIPSNTCDYDSTENYNSEQHNLIELDNKFMLDLNGDCIEDNKAFIYNLGQSLNNIFYYTHIYDFDNSDIFNITFYDSKFNIGHILRFSVEDLNYTVEEWDGTSFNEIGEFFNRDTLEFSVNNYPSNDEQSYLFLIAQVGGVINLTPLNVTEFSYVEISVNKSSSIKQEEFIYSGIYSSPSWTTTKPTYLNVNILGNNYFDIFISDSEHYLNNEYRSERVIINVIDETYCLENIDDFQDSTELLGDYENLNELSGVPLFFSKFIWFIQFPYRLALYFNFLNEIYVATTLLLLFTAFKLFTSFSEMGGEHPFKSVTYTLFFISILLKFMNVVYLPFFVFIMFIGAFQLGGDIFNKD